MFKLAIVISVAFSFLAAAMAYLITYIEYEKHKFPPERLRKECFRAASFAFGTWLVISLTAFYFIFSLVAKR